MYILAIERAGNRWQRSDCQGLAFPHVRHGRPKRSRAPRALASHQQSAAGHIRHR